MELVNPIWDLATRCWDCTAGHAAYITDLKETLASLRSEMEELKATAEDVKLRVQAAEEQGMKAREQVTGWLRSVEEIDEKVKEILRQGDTEGEQGLAKLRSSYKVGKKASELLKSVKEQSSKGEFEEVAYQKPLFSASIRIAEGYCEMPLEKTVGIESIFEDVWDHLNDDTVGIIGLYGMGGVGKTTLLKRINNELPKRGGPFDVASWVVASKQATIEAIQNDILHKLRIPPQSWREKPAHVKSALICQFMRGKKYILMLDDVWERVDLFEVGLPRPDNHNKCKIVFTTRSEEVCGLMEARVRIKVTCLSWEKAWDLFQEKVGEATLSSHYEIPRLAQMVAEECDGLPLALVTIGRAMASRKTPYEWSHALRLLRKYPSKFTGMADHVLPVLKFSYDSLPDEAVKACFVYCSIFPEDYEIPTNKLVDLWVGEGFLKEFDDVSEARSHGLYIVESLKLACLLESSTSQLRVKMHDVIRDMALWIACEYGEQNQKFLTLESSELMGGENSTQERNKNVEKLSLWSNMIKEPILTTLCCNLSTLVVNDTSLTDLPATLFQFIPNVRILDLSRNRTLRRLPAEISKLTHLEYLDLSWTGIRELPEHLSHLIQLKHLLLNYMENLKEFHIDISRLTNLRVFRMNHGPKYPDAFLRNLQSLQHIKDKHLSLLPRDPENFLSLREIAEMCKISEARQTYRYNDELNSTIFKKCKESECSSNIWLHCFGVSAS